MPIEWQLFLVIILGKCVILSLILNFNFGTTVIMLYFALKTTQNSHGSVFLDDLLGTCEAPSQQVFIRPRL